MFALDYSKAFDRLYHNVIMRKFVMVNFLCLLLALCIPTYVIVANVCVLNNCFSDSALVTSGVPQTAFWVLLFSPLS